MVPEHWTALISANNSLYLASNQGKGVYGENTFSHSVLASVGGSGSFALTRSVDLTADGLIDVAYLANSGAPVVLVQTVSGSRIPSRFQPIRFTLLFRLPIWRSFRQPLTRG